MARVVVRLFQLFFRLYHLSRRRWFRIAVACLFLWWALDFLVTLLTETQWQDSLGYGASWRRRLTTQAVLFALTAGSVLLLGVLPLRAAGALPDVPQQVAPAYHAFARALRWLRRHALGLSRLIVFGTALWLGRNVAMHWMDWLLFQHGGDWQSSHPQLGRGVGFYMFRLAGWHLLLDTIWKIVTMLLLLTALLTAIRSFTQLLARRAAASSTAWRGAIALAALWFALRAAAYYLAQFDLVTAQHPTATVPAGMDFTDWHVRRPLLWFAVALNLLVALGFLVSASRFFRRPSFQRKLLVAGLCAWLLPAALNFLAAGLTTRFVVSPDEANRESPFLRAHLRATRAAWQLDQIINSASPAMQPAQKRPTADFDITTLRVWDTPRLHEALRAAAPPPAAQRLSAPQLDRYEINGRTQLIAIAAREAAASSASTWLNQHVQHTQDVQHTQGEGIVACDATRSTPGGQPLILRAAPRLALSNARVFYGAANQTYALSEDVAGGGIILDSWWRRCVWAWRLRDVNLLLYRGAAGKPTWLLWRRAMTERAAALAPCLVAGGEPYPVVADGRVMWMLDLLTATAFYPGARAAAAQPFNAARDSVKMVMDAANGRVVFYAAGAAAGSDPLLRAWQRAWPQLVRPHEKMPPLLRRHRRYPRLLFATQLLMLGGYHDESPRSFYARRDVWNVAREADSAIAEKPDYALLPSWNEREPTSRYVLQGSLTSAAGRRLAGLLRAGCDETNYGRLALLRFADPLRRPAGPQALQAAVASRLMRRAAAANEIGWRMKTGAVLPVAGFPATGLPVAGLALQWRVLLFAPIYMVREKSNSRSDVELWQVAVVDASAPAAPLGIGSTPRLALEQLGQAAPDETATTIAALTMKASRLHDAAQLAAARDWRQAGKLWRQERDVLRQLTNLTKRHSDATAP